MRKYKKGYQNIYMGQGYSIYVKESKLLDFSKIERIYRKLWNKANNHWHNKFWPLTKPFVGKALKFSDQIVEIEENSLILTSRKMKDPAIENDQVRNIEKEYKYNTNLWYRVGLYREVLNYIFIEFIKTKQEEKIGNIYRERYKFKMGQQYKFIVNGNVYWYHITCKNGSHPYPEILSWPEEDIVEYVI